MKGSDPKKTLLDESVRLIAEEGLERLSFREVARRAGVSHQAPYHHFANREGILAAIALEGFARLDVKLLRVRANPRKRAPREVLRELLRAYIKHALANPVHFRIMFRPELAPVRDNAELRAQAMLTFKRLVDCVADCHPRLSAKDKYITATANALWAGAHGVATLWLDGPMQATAPNLAAETLIETATTLLADAAAKGPRQKRSDKFSAAKTASSKIT